MKFGRIDEHGVVQSIIEADELPPMHKDVAKHYREIPDEATSGWRLEGDVIGPPKAPQPLMPLEILQGTDHFIPGRLIEDIVAEVPGLRAKLVGASKQWLEIREKARKDHTGV